MKQFNFTLAQVQNLFAMQDTLNTYIHSEWKTQGFNWHDAIADEAQEILGHLGWKWWKKDYQCGITESNKQQLKLEVIDVLHFVISAAIQGEKTVDQVAEFLNCDFDEILEPSAEVEHSARELRSYGDAPFTCFVNMAHSLDMTEAEILGTYAQKYVLNKFRQDNGYKTGTYEKHWEIPYNSSGQPENNYKLLEDNEVLALVVQRFINLGRDTTDEKALYSELELEYTRRRNK